jgi:AcrR family transcriptional regulator
MAKASSSPKPETPRRLPRGRHALAPDDVLRDQRERLLAAVPVVAAAQGYEAMSVADIVKAAAVSRNAFYKNFSDKQDCVATAHELGHERLFEVLSTSCYEGATIEERVGGSLAAGLDVLADDPALAASSVARRSAFWRHLTLAASGFARESRPRSARESGRAESGSGWGRSCDCWPPIRTSRT